MSVDVHETFETMFHFSKWPTGSETSKTYFWLQLLYFLMDFESVFCVGQREVISFASMRSVFAYLYKQKSYFLSKLASVLFFGFKRKISQPLFIDKLRQTQACYSKFTYRSFKLIYRPTKYMGFKFHQISNMAAMVAILFFDLMSQCLCLKSDSNTFGAI